MVHHVETPLQPPGAAEAVLLWTLLVLFVICTSSLHGFAPFRLDIRTEWSPLPSSIRFIRYNLILTGPSLLAILSLAIPFFRKSRSGTSAGHVSYTNIYWKVPPGLEACCFNPPAGYDYQWSRD